MSKGIPARFIGLRTHLHPQTAFPGKRAASNIKMIVELLNASNERHSMFDLSFINYHSKTLPNEPLRADRFLICWTWQQRHDTRHSATGGVRVLRQIQNKGYTSRLNRLESDAKKIQSKEDSLLSDHRKTKDRKVVKRFNSHRSEHFQN